MQPRVINSKEAAQLCGYDTVAGFRRWKDKQKGFPQHIPNRPGKYDAVAVHAFLDKLNGIKPESAGWDEASLLKRLEKHGHVQNEIRR